MRPHERRASRDSRVSRPTAGPKLHSGVMRTRGNNVSRKQHQTQRSRVHAEPPPGDSPARQPSTEGSRREAIASVGTWVGQA
jgi:hypothetical protein